MVDSRDASDYRDKLDARGCSARVVDEAARNSVADEAVAEAVAALRRGDVIGLPTETVYGLAADASNPEAVRRVFALKGRPADHPVIVHLANAADLDRWARDVPPAARLLAEAFWPGPLTMVLPRAAGVLDLVTGGQDTVGLRVPSHPLAQRVLRAFGGGLAAPSANRFGRVSPTRAAHVVAEFGDEVPVVLDGGDCEVGIESTIVEVREGSVRILRPGRIDAERLRAVLRERHEAREATEVLEGAAASSPRAPGLLRSHYAPRTPVRLVPSSALAAAGAADNGGSVVLGLAALAPGRHGIALGDDPLRYARGLYAALRDLDALGASRILVEEPPPTPHWHAVRDRLARAAAGEGVDDEEA